jgi:hypothetical protein
VANWVDRSPKERQIAPNNKNLTKSPSSPGSPQSGVRNSRF